MSKYLLILFGFICTVSTTLANSLPHVCDRDDETILEMIRDSKNRLSFGNQGGLINGGVCWWHSRFERAAQYLAQFHPELPKPNKKQVRKICDDIAHLRVTNIPGYENLAEFSRENEKEIQNELNEWQLRDGFINQEWIRGLSGTPTLDPKSLEKHMNKIVSRFRKNPHPLFLMLQYPGITSHAHLLVGVHDTEDGYDLEVIDSNRPGEIHTQHYIRSSQTLRDGNDHFIPYPGFMNESKNIRRTALNHCQISS